MIMERRRPRLRNLAYTSIFSVNVGHNRVEQAFMPAVLCDKFPGAAKNFFTENENM
jgi:hypothetical protein